MRTLLLCLLLGATLASTAGPIRGGYTSRPSSSGFRTSSPPSYRSYSTSPSRTFTFSRPAAAPASRPAAAPARTYTFRSEPISRPTTPTAAPAARSSRPAAGRRPVVNNHYHGNSSSGGGGMSMVDYLVLHELVSGNNNSSPGAAQPAAAAGPRHRHDAGQEPELADVPRAAPEEESHGWRNFFLVVVAGCVLYGLVKLIRLAPRRGPTPTSMPARPTPPSFIK